MTWRRLGADAVSQTGYGRRREIAGARLRPTMVPNEIESWAAIQGRGPTRGGLGSGQPCLNHPVGGHWHLAKFFHDSFSKSYR